MSHYAGVYAKGIEEEQPNVEEKLESQRQAAVVLEELGQTNSDPKEILNEVRQSEAYAKYVVMPSIVWDMSETARDGRMSPSLDA